MLEKIKGMIIKTQDYGETHKIITIFSKKLGKFTAIARGANKPKSRMAAVTQPFIYGDFLVYVSTGLSTIQQGEIIQSFRAIREDIIKTAYVAYMMELTDKLIEQRSPAIYIYDQLEKTMQWIENNEDVEIPVMMYELKLYQYGGFAPVVNQCVSCGNQQAPFSFSIREGGLLCARCLGVDSHALSISNNLARLLHIFLNVGLERVGNISIKQENIQLLRDLLNAYYDTYGGYYLKSRNFLNQLDLLK